MTVKEEASATTPTPSRQLRSLTPAQVLAIDRALANLGAFGEIHIIKAKGRVRFLETVRSQDLLKLGHGREGD
jgi:hypothetical protein